MKKTAILVIAATNQPVYIHYIETYWTELIRVLRAERPHIDVFLLFEHDTDLHRFESLGDNVIQDQTSSLDALCEPEFQTGIIPGILSKTVYALELLQDRYDVFFRTNLSSMLRIGHFDRFVQNKNPIKYSGASVWDDGLRQDLLHYDRIGPGKSIKSLLELDDYEGNTFISGSGYFLSSKEVRILLERKEQIRFDIVDDVSMGLMFSEHEALPGFSVTIRPGLSVREMKERIEKSDASHIRLEHFPLKKARALWRELKTGELWK